jgi:hypothetical protein
VLYAHNPPTIRDRLFNLQGGGGYGFFFVQNLIFGQHESYNIFFFEFFFQNLTIGYMTKTLSQIIFIFLHQNQNIFSATLGIS